MRRYSKIKHAGELKNEREKYDVMRFMRRFVKLLIIFSMIFYSIINSILFFLLKYFLLLSNYEYFIAIYLRRIYICYFCVLSVVIINGHNLLNYYIVIMLLVIYVKRIFYNLDYCNCKILKKRIWEK